MRKRRNLKSRVWLKFAKRCVYKRVVVINGVDFLLQCKQLRAEILRSAAGGIMVQDTAIGAIGLGFDSRFGQIRRSVVDGLSPLRHFLSCVAQALSHKDGLVTRFSVIPRV